MQALKITLSGEIQSSNFDDWKSDLLAEIKTIGTSLATDEDFSAATANVKRLKKAEKALKDAKQSALDQAADIQQLFKAIDEVREEARQTRLTLERQIKARKQEIKASVVAGGIDTIKAFIAEQSEDFQLIKHSDFLDEAFFLEALKGRSTLKTSEKAIGKLCKKIKQSITDKAASVTNNAAALAAMPAAEQALFQDRAELLAMEPSALNEVIDSRLSVFREQAGTPAADASGVKTDAGSDSDIDLDFDMQDISDAGEAIGRFDIVVSLKASESHANQLLSELKERFADEKTIESVVIKKIT